MEAVDPLPHSIAQPLGLCHNCLESAAGLRSLSIVTDTIFFFFRTVCVILPIFSGLEVVLISQSAIAWMICSVVRDIQKSSFSDLNSYFQQRISRFYYIRKISLALFWIERYEMSLQLIHSQPLRKRFVCKLEAEWLCECCYSCVSMG